MAHIDLLCTGYKARVKMHTYGVYFTYMYMYMYVAVFNCTHVIYVPYTGNDVMCQTTHNIDNI